MKACPYCGKENDDSLTTCHACGTELTANRPATRPLSSSPCTRAITIAVVVLPILTIALITLSAHLLIIPVLALFYAPIYLPFLISFKLRSPEWTGLRWSLRIGSALAAFIWLTGMSSQPNFGDDVAGDIHGASLNFIWTWGSGLGCAALAITVGFILRNFQSNRADSSPKSGTNT